MSQMKYHLLILPSFLVLAFLGCQYSKPENNRKQRFSTYHIPEDSIVFKNDIHSDVNFRKLLLQIDSATTNSKFIINNPIAEEIKKKGRPMIPLLMKHFADTTETSIYSECIGRDLRLGEVAFIITESIDFMPLFLVTGIQNCLLTFCEDNPNAIEYYFPKEFENERLSSYASNYEDWYYSEDRKEELKQEEKERKHFKKRLKTVRFD